MRYALYCNRQLFHVVSHIYCGGMGSILMLETPEKQLFAEEGIFYSQHAKKYGISGCLIPYSVQRKKVLWLLIACRSHRKTFTSKL